MALAFSTWEYITLADRQRESAHWHSFNVRVMLHQEEGADGVLLLDGLVEQRQAGGVALVDVGPSGEEGGGRLVQASPQGQAQHRLALWVLQVEVGHHAHVVRALLHLHCNRHSL